MAASVKVCDKTSGKISRYSLPDIQLTDSVARIKSLIAQRNDFAAEKFGESRVIACFDVLFERFSKYRSTVCQSSFPYTVTGSIEAILPLLARLQTPDPDIPCQMLTSLVTA